MPATLTYPGVYIEEIPSGVRTIIGVATSITAFVGAAPRGPVDEPIVINNNGDYERIFGGLSNDSSMGFAVRDFFLNGGSQAIVVRVNNGGAATKFKLPAGPGNLELQAASPGKWGDNLSLTVDKLTKDPNNTKQFNLTLVEKDPLTQQIVRSETFLNLSVDPADPRYLPAVLEQSSELIRSVRDNNGVWVVPPDRPDDGTKDVTTGTAGKASATLTNAQFTGGTLDNDKKGIYALRDADLFNILCIPPYKTDANVDGNVVGDAAAFCEKQRAFLIVDPPSTWKKKDDAVKGIKAAGGVGTTSKNAAVFFPRLTKPNPLNDNQMEDFVPCGAVAGIFARTDTNRGVWKAPAGLDATLVGVPQLSVPLTDAENGELNPLGVNCLRTMPAAGAVVWGPAPCRGATGLLQNGNTFPFGAPRSSSRRPSTATRNGSCSNPTTSRFGRRSG